MSFAEDLFLKALDSAPKEFLEAPAEAEEPFQLDEEQMRAQRMSLQAVLTAQTQQHQTWTQNDDSELQEMTQQLRAQTQQLAQTAQAKLQEQQEQRQRQQQLEQQQLQQQQWEREAPQRAAAAAAASAKAIAEQAEAQMVKDPQVLKFAAQATAKHQAEAKSAPDPLSAAQSAMAAASASAKAMADPQIWQAASKTNDPLGIAAALAKALASDQEFTGKIKWYNPDRGIGSIECWDTMRLTGDDVTVFGGKTLGIVPVGGDEVRFTLRKNQDRGFKANNVFFPKGDADAALATRDQKVSTALSQMHQGRIVSYDQQKGFGFITCDGLRDLFHKDIFFMKTSLKGSRDAFQKGVSVNFRFAMAKRGPEANQIFLPGTTLDPSTEVDGWALKERIEIAKKKVHQGSIISYDQRGFGFISCAPVRDLFGKDIFWMKTALKGRQADYQVGTTVNFLFEQTDRGPEAKTIELVGMPGATLWYSLGDEPPWAVQSRGSVYGYQSVPSGMPAPCSQPIGGVAPAEALGEPGRKKRRGWDDGPSTTVAPYIWSSDASTAPDSKESFML